MTKQQDLQALATTGQAVAASLHVQRLEIVRDALSAMGFSAVYRRIENVEDLSAEELAAYPTSGSIFEPVEAVLKNAGIPTDGTIGSVAMRELGLSLKEIHDVSCECMSNDGKDSTTITAAWAAFAFGNIVRDRMGDDGGTRA